MSCFSHQVSCDGVEANGHMHAGVTGTAAAAHPVAVTVLYNRPPALYRLRVKTPTDYRGPVWAFTKMKKPIRGPIFLV